MLTDIVQKQNRDKRKPENILNDTVHLANYKRLTVIIPIKDITPKNCLVKHVCECTRNM